MATYNVTATRTTGTTQTASFQVSADNADAAHRMAAEKLADDSGSITWVNPPATIPTGSGTVHINTVSPV